MQPPAGSDTYLFQTTYCQELSIKEILLVSFDLSLLSGGAVERRVTPPMKERDVFAECEHFMY
jgi:hypothetical protein